MYWQSLWFRSPAADPSARGIFYLAAIAHKKSDDNILSQQATAAALKTERERTKAQAVRATRRAQSARPARDRQASDIILSIGHNSSLATPTPGVGRAFWAAIARQITCAASPSW